MAKYEVAAEEGIVLNDEQYDKGFVFDVEVEQTLSGHKVADLIAEGKLKPVEVPKEGGEQDSSQPSAGEPATAPAPTETPNIPADTTTPIQTDADNAAPAGTVQTA